EALHVLGGEGRRRGRLRPPQIALRGAELGRELHGLPEQLRRDHLREPRRGFRGDRQLAGPVGVAGGLLAWRRAGRAGLVGVAGGLLTWRRAGRAGLVGVAGGLLTWRRAGRAGLVGVAGGLLTWRRARAGDRI